MATQNKEQARELLLAFPNLSKALFQVHIFGISLVVYRFHAMLVLG